jgi:hypothetical protein
MSSKTRIVFDGNCTEHRFARTLDEAFGPHCRKHITEPDEPMHPTDRIVVIASAIAALVLIGLIAWGQVQ